MPAPGPFVGAVMALVAAPLLVAAAVLFVLRLHVTRSLRRTGEDARGAPTVVGFLHPFCNDGGGGERVRYDAGHDEISGVSPVAPTFAATR